SDLRPFPLRSRRARGWCPRSAEARAAAAAAAAVPHRADRTVRAVLLVAASPAVKAPQAVAVAVASQDNTRVDKAREVRSSPADPGPVVLQSAPAPPPAALLVALLGVALPLAQLVVRGGQLLALRPIARKRCAAVPMTSQVAHRAMRRDHVAAAGEQVERTYGNWRKPRTPGIGKLGLLGTLILMGGMVATIMSMMFFGPLAAFVVAAVVAAVLTPLLIQDRHGRTALQAAPARIAGWRGR